MNKDETVIFWSNQFKEHAFFINIGLIDEDIINLNITKLKRIAKNWQEYWANIHSEYKKNDKYKDSIESILDNCKAFKSFKKSVIVHINDSFCSWLIPDFVDHLKDELDYFINVLTDNITPLEVIKFWTEINKDHSQTIFQQLDSTEIDLFNKSLIFSKELTVLNTHINDEEDKQFCLLSLHCIDELDKFVSELKIGIDNRNIKSAIHPLLIDHIKREGMRSITDIKLALNSLSV